MIQKTIQPFESFVESVRARATHAFNLEGSIKPSWFLQTETGEVLFIVTEYTTDLDKDFVDCAMRETFVTRKVISFVHVLEAWIVHVQELKDIKDYKGPRPKDHPNRSEALVLMAEDINGRSLNGFCQIHRNPVDDTAMIDEIKIIGDAQPEQGRFVRMFQRN